MTQLIFVPLLHPSIESKVAMSYAKQDEYYRRHHLRYIRRVEAMKPQLICQECGGAGGEKDVILEDGTGPWEECGFCEGTGLLTPWLRGLWLRFKREEKVKG